MTDPTLSLAPSPAGLRRELESLIVGDLLGPAGGDDETLPGRSRVRDRYLVGMLAPAGTLAIDPERADGAAVDGDTAPVEDSSLDDASAAQPNLFPSSFGFTCVVGSGTDELAVTASWGRYHKEKAESEGDSRAGTIWRRHPAGGSAGLALAEGDLGPLSVDAEQPDVVVRGRATRTAAGGWLVTLFLVNEQTPPKVNKDEAWLFQAQLFVEDPDGAAVFVGRGEAIPELTAAGEISEIQLLDMQYRHRVEFAAGHGVAMHADTAPDDPTRAVRVSTAVIPSAIVEATEAPTASDESLSVRVRDALTRVELDMEILAGLEGEPLRSALTPLADAYELWLDEQEARLGDPASRLAGHEDAAAVALAEARVMARRLRAGIEVAAGDTAAGEAFRFANEAMWLQRIHTLAGNRRRENPDLEMNVALAEFAPAQYHSWRPFQLAFLLVNLPALTDPAHDERSTDAGLVDLLFFPTGGGKTEAYLGLTAFTLAIRRLQGTVSGFDGRSGGVAVLMRYTLRLLTAQQFQRAAALICACEQLRRGRIAAGDERWGETPFRLGMWVGSNVTPNTNIDAGYALEDARGQGRRRGGRSSPVQLVACPWCGSRLDPGRDAKTDADRWRTLVYCSDAFGSCPFTEVGSPGEGIPVITVDDELYRLLPAFIISTADKFAQLPWKGPLHLLFGRVTQRCTRHGYRSPDLDKVGQREERNSHNATGSLPKATTIPCDPLRPPDLIIQDELHLISGPLGTLVGLYETAIDRLASWSIDGKVVRPKVVASTATVRRAPEQVHALFDRQLAVFPPPVLDVEHAFFAEQRPVSDDHPGRQYLGICAHGQRLKSVEVRVFTSLLAAAQRLFERYGEAADPWMTLVAYFGALRELGGAKRLVDDDVKARLRKTDQRGLAKRTLRVVQELTSRISSTDIPDVLDQLGERFTPPKLDPDGKPIRSNGDRLPIDVLLATSMISVGVDVGRLGFMCAVGQPKTTAEYIQATSRVGRDRSGPGLVITIYNWARPRDLSHYETFEHYHATFYRHVEALSVTPFSSRALDRGLTATFVSLLRHAAQPAWNPNTGAQVVDVTAAIVDELVDVIAARGADVGSDADVEDEVRRMLEFRLDRWKAAQGVVGVQLGYKEDTGTIKGLLHEPTLGTWDEFSCPNSLRETEPTVNLIIGDWEQDPSLAGAPTFVLGAGEARPRPETAEDEDAAEADAEEAAV
ncbi:MAG: DISARM system helicase DrmA [Acidimicrobiia bacterium]